MKTLLCGDPHCVLKVPEPSLYLLGLETFRPCIRDPGTKHFTVYDRLFGIDNISLLLRYVCFRRKRLYHWHYWRDVEMFSFCFHSGYIFTQMCNKNLPLFWRD